MKKQTPNPGPGRPCFAPGKASDTWLQVRLTEAQKRHYAKHAKPASLSQWVKLTLDKASNYKSVELLY